MTMILRLRLLPLLLSLPVPMLAQTGALNWRNGTRFVHDNQ